MIWKGSFLGDGFVLQTTACCRILTIDNLVRRGFVLVNWFRRKGWWRFFGVREGARLGRGVGRLGHVGSLVFNVVALVGAESSHFPRGGSVFIMVRE
ncbi:hypothetical protein CsSME_00024309 [Camellia sinensis var. sinensis]